METKLQSTPRSKGLKVGFIWGIVIDAILLGQDWLFSGNSISDVKRDMIGNYVSWGEFFSQMWWLYLIIGGMVIVFSIMIVTIYFLIKDWLKKK